MTTPNRIELVESDGKPLFNRQPTDVFPRPRAEFVRARGELDRHQRWGMHPPGGQLLKTGPDPADPWGMLEDSQYHADAAYTLALDPPNRPAAATEISIRVDDGADIVIDVASSARDPIHAYLTMDQAEDLHAALSEILRFPTDRTGSVDLSGPIPSDDDAVPKLR